jgi:Ribbon-helix-helix protein, copG family
MKTITCKIPEKLDAELMAAARAEGISKSQILRRALEDRIGRGQYKKAPRAFDLVKDLSGSVKAPADLLSNPKYMENLGTCTGSAS